LASEGPEDPRRAAVALAARSLESAQALLEQREWELAGKALRAATAQVDWLAWSDHGK